MPAGATVRGAAGTSRGRAVATITTLEGLDPKEEKAL